MKTIFMLSFLLFFVACTTIIAEKEDIVSTQKNNNLVDPNDLLSGGPPKDGIPSIDNPKFTSVDEAKWIPETAEVFLLEGIEEIKIYPQPILVWHEIVNDLIDQTPVAVTYCPLCGSSVAYIRIVNDKTTTFGTTGKLYNSNLVMYDRLTDTYWTQIRGEAIIGELAGDKLEKIPLQTMTWKTARERFPQAKVLSRETGHNRDYTRDPYSSYYDSDSLFFPVENSDSRLHSKTIIIGLSVNEEDKAYPEFLLKEQKIITDTLGGNKLTITYDDGFIKIIDEEENSLAWERDFWFAWAAFHPKTKIYEEK